LVPDIVGHHTKDKGNLGVAKAHADLVAQGYIVLLPLTEHAPFDVVAYSDERFWRVQVKCRALRAGTVRVIFESTWADVNGIHKRPTDKSQIDIVCIYCPDTDECYYFDPKNCGTSVKLRVTPSLNNQKVGIIDASNLRFMPTEARLPASAAAAPAAAATEPAEAASA
jgi:hypothetical protein